MTINKHLIVHISRYIHHDARNRRLGLITANAHCMRLHRIHHDVAGSHGRNCINQVNDHAIGVREPHLFVSQRRIGGDLHLHPILGSRYGDIAHRSRPLRSIDCSARRRWRRRSVLQPQLDSQRHFTEGHDGVRGECYLDARHFVAPVAEAGYVV